MLPNTPQAQQQEQQQQINDEIDVLFNALLMLEVEVSELIRIIEDIRERRQQEAEKTKRPD